VLDLEPLEREEVTALLASRADAPLSPTLTNAIIARLATPRSKSLPRGRLGLLIRPG
jgi:hypothetical protein